MTNENSTIIHEGVTSINGTLFRKVNRKANVGEKVLHYYGGRSLDEPTVVLDADNSEVKVFYIDNEGDEVYGIQHGSYLVLEPVVDEETLTLTEADVRNNPRQVIDLLGNLALRLSQLESKVERLGDTSEQAISTVARNVETWAQETERIKHVMESPSPWADESFVIELSKKVTEIDAKLSVVDERTQPYQVAHDIFVKIAEGRRLR